MDPSTENYSLHPSGELHTTYGKLCLLGDAPCHSSSQELPEGFRILPSPILEVMCPSVGREETVVTEETEMDDTPKDHCYAIPDQLLPSPLNTGRHYAVKIIGGQGINVLFKIWPSYSLPLPSAETFLEYPSSVNIVNIPSV